MYAKEHRLEKQREAQRRFRERNAERLKQEKDQYYLEHRNELREYWRKKTARWRKEQKEAAQDINKRYYANAKLKAFGILGNACKNCGWTDLRALQVDHIEAIGDATRRRLEHRGIKLYRAVLKYPESFQLLCANCNWIKRVERNEIKKSDSCLTTSALVND